MAHLHTSYMRPFFISSCFGVYVNMCMGCRMSLVSMSLPEILEEKDDGISNGLMMRKQRKGLKGFW